MFRGVVDGSLERVVAEFVTHEPNAKGASPVAMSASALFEQAQVTRAPMRLLTPQDTSFARGLPENTLARLRNDLAHGYLTVAPARAITVGGTPRFAWWRIDPRSGETIAMTDEGLHGAAEYQFTISEGKDTVVVMEEGYIGETGPIPLEEKLSGTIGQLGKFIDELMGEEGDVILHLRPYGP